MSKRFGNDYLFWIKDAGGEWNVVKGNTALSRSRNRGSFDISSKEDYPYSPQGQSAKTLSISASFRPDLPDADGFGRLETLVAGNDPFEIQIRKGGVAGTDPDDVIFEGMMHSGDFSDDFPQNNVVQVSTTFSIAAAPTVDRLL